MHPTAADRFELLRKIGAGGFGVVYEARDSRDGRSVAVKVLHTVDALAESRFEREAALLAELVHPSIVGYVAHGRTRAGSAYLAMEWLDGQTLDARLQGGPLSIDEALALARSAVSGLTAAFRLGIVHRDLKPANLLLVANQASATKILDFGLARRLEDSQSQALTRTGVAIGTPHYMSPEQARGERYIDTASDVFSLGSVLYEALTGQRPFDTNHPLATLMMICVEEPARLETLRAGVPPMLARLVHAMLSKQRSARPVLAAIAQELERIAASVAEHVESLTMSMMLGGVPGPAAAKGVLTPRGQQRVLSAVFVGRAERPPAELEEKLSVLYARFGARGERLLDGSRILMLDSHVTPSEQALAAARCSLALRELLVGVSMAVCTGRAVVDRRLPLGDLIERGARLLSEATPGAVHVDEASAALLDARFEMLGEQGQRILDRERIGGEAPRTLLGQVTPFVGRARELDRLEGICRECVEDSVGRAVLVIAPAGGGKSRLRYELVQRLRDAEPAFTLLLAQGDSMRTATPFGVLAPALQAWAQLSNADSPAVQQRKLLTRVQQVLPAERAEVVAHFLGELSGVPFADEGHPHMRAARSDPQLMADRLLASFLDWLEALCAAGPVAFLAEDLHWADPASVRLLDMALGTLQARPFVVLAFARPEVRDAFPKLWADRDLFEIRLPKLGTRACEQLLHSIGSAELSASTQAWLIERAEGNPFFLEELVRGLREHVDDRDSLPDTIVGMIQARLDALGEGPKLMIRAASVFGQVFRADGARALLGEHTAQLDVPGWLRLLTDREVIYARGEPSEREYAFRHALIRDAAYALLPDDERRLGHRLSAEWLEGKGATEAVLLADHFERGAVFERAAHWYGAAATEALEASSLAEVVRCGERAVACGATGHPLGAVASLVAEALSYAGDDADAAEWADLARTNVALASGPWWRASQVLCVSRFRQGSAALAFSVVEQMLAQPQPQASAPEAVLALAHVAHCCALYAPSEPDTRRILAWLPVQADPALGARVEGCIHAVWVLAALIAGNLDLALRHSRMALTAARRAGAARDVVQQLGINAWLLGEVGAYEEAEALYLETIDQGRRLALGPDIANAQQNLGLSYLQRGQLEAAVRELRRASLVLADLDLPVEEALALSCLALAEMACGELASAAEVVSKASRLGRSDPSAHASALVMSAKLDLLGGRHATALASVTEALQLLRSRTGLDHLALVRIVHVESLLACGRHEEACVALVEARGWLLERAEKIADGEARHAFLTRVPDNVRLLSLATELLPPA